MKPKKHPRGVALITALMIVAIATTLIVGLTHQHQLDIRRASNMINSDQAYQYALGAESWAMSLLYRDKQIDVIDHLKEDWAQTLAPIEVPGGHITVQLTDLQGRININNLYFDENAANNPNNPNPNDPNTKTPDNNPGTPPNNNGFNPQLPGINIKQNLTARQLVILISDYQLQSENSQEKPQGLAQPLPPGGDLSSVDLETVFTPLIDWMDPDVEPRGINGAEDQYYLGLPHPYRTANQIITSITELRLVKGVTPVIYHALAPYITALPVKTTININTAPMQVLRSLGMDPVAAATIIAERDKTPFKTILEFTDHPLIKNLNLSGNALGIRSEHYLLEAVAEIGRGRATINSVLYREKSGKVQVLYRSSGQL